MRGSVALVYFVLVVNVVKAVNIAKRNEVLREKALYKCVSLLILLFHPDITAMVNRALKTNYLCICLPIYYHYY